MKKVNLYDSRNTKKFDYAKRYIKVPEVTAVEVTPDLLDSHDNPNIVIERGVPYWITYRMEEGMTEFGDKIRTRHVESTHILHIGDFIVTNPPNKDGLKTSHPMNSDTFHRNYERIREKPGHYRSRGIVKAFQNDTSDSVHVEPPESWGPEAQPLTGDRKCWFVMDLASGDRYLMSDDDFNSTYVENIHVKSSR